jgi:PAS domain-containing protein
MEDRVHTRQPFKLAGLSRQFRLVLDRIDLPICYYDADLVIHFVNRQYADFIGLPESGSWVGRSQRSSAPTCSARCRAISSAHCSARQ